MLFLCGNLKLTMNGAMVKAFEAVEFGGVSECMAKKKGGLSASDPPLIHTQASEWRRSSRLPSSYLTV